MSPLPLLIFDLDGLRFGLNATAVLETVRLPELTPIAEAPPWVVGMFSLRGPIVPVIDLHLRFGHPAKPYALSDQIVIIKTEHGRIGLVVSEVLEVTELLPEEIKTPPEFDSGYQIMAHLTAGMACIAEDLVTILDITQLEHLPHASEHSEAAESVEPKANLYAENTPEAISLRHSRAMTLRKTALSEEVSRLGLAVVEIGGEYFGIELTAIQELCCVAQVTAIPCCPPHILGAISLRGNLLTLLDLCRVLNLPLAIRNNKAVVAKHRNTLLAIAVDEIHDVVYLRHKDLQAPPSALGDRLGAEIRGTAIYADKNIIVLDLPTLLTREDWIVDETV